MFIFLLKDLFCDFCGQRLINGGKPLFGRMANRKLSRLMRLKDSVPDDDFMVPDDFTQKLGCRGILTCRVCSVLLLYTTASCFQP